MKRHRIAFTFCSENLKTYIFHSEEERTAKLNIANSVWFRDNDFTAENRSYRRMPIITVRQHTRRHLMSNR